MFYMDDDLFGTVAHDPAYGHYRCLAPACTYPVRTSMDSTELQDAYADRHAAAKYLPPARPRPLLDHVLDEIRRAQGLFGDQVELPDGTGVKGDTMLADIAKSWVARGVEAGSLTWRDILREEYYEALAESDPVLLSTELIQVAAVCLRWAHAIRTRKAGE